MLKLNEYQCLQEFELKRQERKLFLDQKEIKKRHRN